MERITFETKEQIDYFYKQSNSWFAYSSFVWINLFESDNDHFFQKVGDNAFVVSYENGKNEEAIISIPYFTKLNEKNISELKKNSE